MDPPTNVSQIAVTLKVNCVVFASALCNGDRHSPARRARRKRTRGAERRWRRGAIDAFRGTLPSNICETSSTSASLRFVKLSARMREPSTVPFHWDPRLQQPPKKQPWRLLQNNSECANVLWYCLDGQLCQRKNSIHPFVNISQNC